MTKIYHQAHSTVSNSCWLSSGEPVLLGAQHFVNRVLQRAARLGGAGRLLRIAPVVEDSHLMYTLQRAGRRTPLLSAVFTIEVGHRVVGQRNTWITALL